MTEHFAFCMPHVTLKSVVNEKGQEEFFVEGLVSTSDLDLVNDIITPKALSDMLDQFNQRVIKLDWEHETLLKSKEEGFAGLTRVPVGKAVNAQLSEEGLRVRFKLNPDYKRFDEKGNVVMTISDVVQNVKNKFLDAFSVAFIPVETAVTELVDGTKARILDGLRMLNVALTGTPINTSARLDRAMAKSLSFLKNNEVKGMSETQKKTPEAKAQLAEQEAVAEAKASEAQAELKSELKSLSADLKSLKESFEGVNEKLSKAEAKNEKLAEELADVKGVLEKARPKANAEQANPARAEQKSATMVGPIDML